MAVTPKGDGHFYSGFNVDNHPTPRYSHPESKPLHGPVAIFKLERGQNEAHSQAPPDRHPSYRRRLRRTHLRDRATWLWRPPPRITCSSDDGRRNWCDIGPSRDVRLVRQISDSPCIQDDTWGVDRRGLWVDRGCRAEFFIGRREPPPPPITVTCSSNDGHRNWCDIGPSRDRDVRMARQISGSPCIQDDTWGVDQRGLWVDRGCRADFLVGRFEPPPPPVTVTCSSNDGGRNWCDIGPRGEVRLIRQISGSPCVRGQTWDIDNRGLWVDRGCRADFEAR